MLDKLDRIATKFARLSIKWMNGLPTHQKVEKARCEASEAFSRFIDAKGKSDEEYKAMIDCIGCMSVLLADNENLRKEREELRARLKGYE